MKKRKHHYVGRWYLRAWSRRDQIFCQRDGKVFAAALENLAQQRDFYRIAELNDKERTYLRALIGQPSKQLRELHENWIQIFDMPFQLREFASQFGLDQSQVNELIDCAQNDFEEELHAAAEQSNLKIVKALLRNDLAILEQNELYAEFLYFSGLQYFRTKKMRKRLFQAQQACKVRFPELADGIDFSKLSGIMTQVFATNVGGALFSQNFRVILIENVTSIPFLTCDQPVINLEATESNGGLVEKIEMYYPISPRLAVLITDRHEGVHCKRLINQVAEIEVFNRHVILNSDELIFASSREQLDGLLAKRSMP